MAKGRELSIGNRSVLGTNTTFPGMAPSAMRTPMSFVLLPDHVGRHAGRPSDVINTSNEFHMCFTIGHYTPLRMWIGNRTLFAACFLAAVLSIFMGCSASTPNTPVSLKGAGATAPYLVYSKWVEAYRKADPRVNLQYESTGSGAGIQVLKAQTVDFAASDMPLTDEEIGMMAVKPLHFPTLVGAIVPVYNVPKVGTLNFTGDVLAGIFSGRIRSWNDRALVQLNPTAALPASPIIVVHRAGASGSTYAFTDYRSQISEMCKKDIGRGGTVPWPTGEAAAGNPALAKLVKKTLYSIGYVELNYAIQEALSYGYVRNAEGKFEKPDFRAMGAAADAVENMKTDFRASITNSPAKGAYPICTLTWLVVPSHITNASKLREMKRFLRWAYSDGQQIALKMDYGSSSRHSQITSATKSQKFNSCHVQMLFLGLPEPLYPRGKIG